MKAVPVVLAAATAAPLASCKEAKAGEAAPRAAMAPSAVACPEKAAARAAVEVERLGS